MKNFDNCYIYVNFANTSRWIFIPLLRMSKTCKRDYIPVKSGKFNEESIIEFRQVLCSHSYMGARTVFTLFRLHGYFQNLTG